MSLPATDQIWPVEERRKDRWTIKRDFALETNEMRPRSFITQKFFEDLLLLLPCLLLLSPQQLSTCSLRMKINNGRKGFTQDRRAGEREPLLTCFLTVPSYRTYIPFPSVTSSLSSASNYRWEKAWTLNKRYGIREWYMKWKAGNRAEDER